VHHYEPASKHYAWNGNASLPGTKKFKHVPPAVKVILSLFWDFNGTIFKHYHDHGQTVNSTRHCAMLEEELKPTICSKRRGVLINGVVLHHDNT
jgi:hypothetical protein